MGRQNRKVVAAVALIIVSGLVLSACGRRGALEAPVSAAVVTTDNAGNPVKKTAPKADKPFILDGLI